MYSIPNKNNKNNLPTKKTLDIQHTIKMQQFQDKEQFIFCLQEKSHKLKIELNVFETKNPTEITDDDMNKMINIQDEILNLEKQLQDMDPNADEIDYLINTGNILFKYYDIIDKGSLQEESMLMNKKNVVENSILKYLLSKSKSPESNEDNSFNDMNDKASLLEKYMECTEYNYVKNIELENKDKCHFCDSSNRNIMLNDGIIYCNNCCTVEYIIIDHDRPSYKDPPRLWAEKSDCGNYQNMFPLKQYSILILRIFLIL